MSKRKKRKMVYILIALPIAVILLIYFIISLNPLRKPNSEIREDILEITPIGTSMTDVIQVIRSRSGWNIININYERGYMSRANGRPRIGEKSIMAYIGGYPTIIGGSAVYTEWGFDGEGKLIDVQVWNEIK